MQTWTIWGGSGIVLKTLHMNGTVPYWVCMGEAAIILRLALFPLVIQGARAASNFAKVAPEVQFIVTMFMNDREKLKARRASPKEKRELNRLSRETVWNMYKAYDINPWAVFKSPLIQIPCFWYFSIDIRKVISGIDPQLATDLSEGGILWFTDLTDPDPWFVLPVLSGMLLYLNVEIAMGKKSLSGETASKANFAVYMKDFFQSLSIFIPCFMATSTAGTQIYLLGSFTFTLAQSIALRTESFRKLCNLPSMDVKYDATIAEEYKKLVEMQNAAIEARGNKPVLGTGVLAPGWVASFEGEKKESSIKTSDAVELPFKMEREFMPNIPTEVMDAANSGRSLPRPIIMAPVDQPKETNPLNMKKISKKFQKKKGNRGKKS